MLRCVLLLACALCILGRPAAAGFKLPARISCSDGPCDLRLISGNSKALPRRAEHAKPPRRPREHPVDHFACGPFPGADHALNSAPIVFFVPLFAATPLIGLRLPPAQRSHGERKNGALLPCLRKLRYYQICWHPQQPPPCQTPLHLPLRAGPAGQQPRRPPLAPARSCIMPVCYLTLTLPANLEL